VKGAHLDGATFSDLLATPQGERLFPRERIVTTSTHGTGCTLASAIAALVALGAPLEEAVLEAGEYVRGAITHALGLGHGHGPLHHGWVLRDRG
jgi:hydroxymethylpyrimidine/phosphomethylpyrimidine kinase